MIDPRQNEAIDSLCGLAEEKQGDDPELADRLWDIAHVLEHVRWHRPVAEIDAEEFAAAIRDPGVQRLIKAADRHLEQLRSEGRI